MVQMRQANASDLDFVLKVQKEAMSPATIEVHGCWNDELQKQNTNIETISSYEIISSEGRDIGALQVFEKKDCLEFSRIYISPELQSKGYGSAAMRAILARAENLGKKEITFKVYKINRRAITLYEKVGCEIVDEVDPHFIMTYKLTRKDTPQIHDIEV